MSEWSGFFDAHRVGESWDRTYLAEDFAKFFAPLVGNGVFAGRSNELQVFQASPANLSVIVSSGQSWIEGYGYYNSSDLTLPVDPADGALGRIDRVVNRWSASDRQIRTVCKKGTPAVNPIAPPLQWDADCKELNLATIEVSAGLSAITQDKIKDTRADSSVCGWVTGLIEQVDTSTLFAQWDKAYEEFFLLIQEELSNLKDSAAFVFKSGDRMTGDLTMNGHRVRQIGAPTDVGDAVNLGYALTKFAHARILVKENEYATGNQEFLAQSWEIPGLSSQYDGIEIVYRETTSTSSAKHTTGVIPFNDWAYLSLSANITGDTVTRFAEVDGDTVKFTDCLRFSNVSGGRETYNTGCIPLEIYGYTVGGSSEDQDSPTHTPVQPDWNQNDPTAPDYIANRTHYEYEGVQEASITADTGSNFDVAILDKIYEQRKTAKYKRKTEEYFYDSDIEGSRNFYISNGEDVIEVRISGSSLSFRFKDSFKVPTVTITYEEEVTKIHKIDEKYLPSREPYVIDSEAYTYGDDALAAILEGRQILVKVPNKDTTNTLYSNFMPVLQYQLPNDNNNYLILFYLKDGIAENLLTALQAAMQGDTSAFDGIYGVIEMMLSQSYSECPLKVSPIK